MASRFDELFDWDSTIDFPGYVTILKVHPQQQKDASECNMASIRHEESGIVNKVTKKYAMTVPLPGFEPEDVKVKVKGRLLTVEAKYEKTEEKNGIFSRSLREVLRTFPLPEQVDQANIKSSLTTTGTLEIEAPWKTTAENDRTSKSIEVETATPLHDDDAETKMPERTTASAEADNEGEASSPSAKES